MRALAGRKLAGGSVAGTGVGGRSVAVAGRGVAVAGADVGALVAVGGTCVACGTVVGAGKSSGISSRASASSLSAGAAIVGKTPPAGVGLRRMRMNGNWSMTRCCWAGFRISRNAKMTKTSPNTSARNERMQPQNSQRGGAPPSSRRNNARLGWVSCRLRKGGCSLLMDAVNIA